MDKPSGQQALRVLVVGVGDKSITFLDRLFEGLAANGVEVILASDRRPVKDRFQAQKISWLWAPSWDKPAFLRLVYFLALVLVNSPSRAFRSLIRASGTQKSLRHGLAHLYRMLPFARVKADCIYFPWNSTAIGYRALNALGLPMVVSCRGRQVNIRPHLPGNERYASDLRRSFSAASRVHCVSLDIMREAVQYGLEPSKAVVIRPAVDPAYFLPAEKKPANNTFTLLSTGSLIWRKGYEYALASIRKLVDSGIDCELLIIGDGPEKARILYTIQDLNLTDRVKLLGKQPPSVVLANLQQADVFLLSSLSEGISNAVLEAMSCGLPVVTTDCGGMREAVNDGVEGYVVPVRDSAVMAERLTRLYEDAGLRARMGSAGRERVLREFNQKDQVSAFLNLLVKACDRQ